MTLGFSIAPRMSLARGNRVKASACTVDKVAINDGSQGRRAPLRRDPARGEGEP